MHYIGKWYLYELKELISNAVQIEIVNDSLLENDAEDQMKTSDTSLLLGTTSKNMRPRMRIKRRFK